MQAASTPPPKLPNILKIRASALGEGSATPPLVLDWFEVALKAFILKLAYKHEDGVESVMDKGLAALVCDPYARNSKLQACANILKVFFFGGY